MTARHTRRVVPAILVAASIVAPGSAGAQDADAESASLSNAEIEALYRARQDSARMRFTDADVEFVTGMISHHAQALIMSELAPTHGASPAVETLAARIINAQRDEIALMQRWLTDRGQLVPQVKIDGLNLMIEMKAPAGDAGHEAGMTPDDHDDPAPAADHTMHDMAEQHMPGMLTREQLEELAYAFGSEFDRLFLTYMIGHHTGAVTMVDDLFAVDGTGQDAAVFKLASDVQVDQITEIGRMQLMLDSIAASTGPDGGR